MYRRLLHNIKKNINLTFIGSIFLEKNLHYDRVDIIYSLMRKFNNKFIAINFSNKFFLSYFFALFKSIYKFSIFKDFSFFFKILYIYSFARKPIFGKDMYNVLSKTKILINTHIGDTEFAGNMRLFEGTGLGCLVITDKKKGLEKLFNIGDEIDIFLNKKKSDFNRSRTIGISNDNLMYFNKEILDIKKVILN